MKNQSRLGWGWRRHECESRFLEYVATYANRNKQAAGRPYSNGAGQCPLMGSSLGVFFTGEIEIEIKNSKMRAYFRVSIAKI
jgi:hypothetical protein